MKSQEVARSVALPIPSASADATAPVTAAGLDGVVVASTALSEVDGARGRLRLAGHDVEAWVLTTSYERAAEVLLGAGAARATDALAARLGQARAAAWARLPALGDALAARDGMAALRAGLAHLDASGEDVDDALACAGAAGVLLGAWARTREGHAPIPPEPDAGHAADVLRMATGVRDARRAAALEAYLVTVMDHGMNASTFTARVVTSTGSDLVSAVVAAVGALKGPLHGGAPGPVLDMLDAIGEPARALPWLRAELDAGRRIMGMGHRIYRVRDPRAAVLERVARGLSDDGAGGPRLALAQAVERAAAELLAERKPDRALRANVEFYTAVVLDAVGLPAAAFAPCFAVGRVIGWAAHALEQRRVGRLIRPDSRYVGPVHVAPEPS
ncbi:MAG: citrate synthase [Kofleriaceae bacterium]